MLDLTPIITPILTLVGLVLAGVFVKLVDKAINVAQAKHILQLNAHDVQTVHDAADTAAGVIASMLARGTIGISSVHVSNPMLLSVAQTTLQRVLSAADATGVTLPDLAQIIVGRVGTLISADPTIPTVPTVPAAPAVAVALAIPKAA